MFFLRSSAGFTIIFLLAVQVRANSGATEKTEEKIVAANEKNPFLMRFLLLSKI